LSAWFSRNGLSLNTEKANIVAFSSNHLPNDLFQIAYQNKTIKVATNIKFLWLELDKCVNWKNHIDKILPRMSSAGYAVRSMYYLSCVTRHMMFYFAYFQSVMEYNIIFWGNLKESKRVIQL
jgi:hypothetical protein